jgi:DNA mismatch endonuclease, patch repair protein
MQSNRSAGTGSEMQLRRALHAQGLRYRVNYPVDVPGLRVRPDVVFTRQRLALFSDGCFWHRCPQHATDPKANSDYWAPKLRANVARDRLVDEALQQAGWTVVRVWEHESVEVAVRRVVSALGNGEA